MVIKNDIFLKKYIFRQMIRSEVLTTGHISFLLLFSGLFLWYTIDYRKMLTRFNLSNVSWTLFLVCVFIFYIHFPHIFPWTHSLIQFFPVFYRVNLQRKESALKIDENSLNFGVSNRSKENWKAIWSGFVR